MLFTATKNWRNKVWIHFSALRLFYTTLWSRMDELKRIFKHNLISELDEIVKFAFHLFHTQWKISRYLLNRKLGESRRPSGCCGDNRLCLCGGSKRQIFKPSCKWENNTKKDMRERWIKAWAILVKRTVVKRSKNFTFTWPCVVTNFFIIKPTSCTNFTNLLRHEILHVSGSFCAHHQEFIHCTLGTGICHTGL